MGSPKVPRDLASSTPGRLTFHANKINATFGGRVTAMGLGNAALSAARDKADESRKFVASGINPIEAQREADD